MAKSNKKPTAPVGDPSVPDGTRIYAIGDVHGRLDLLRLLHDSILAHAAYAPAARKVMVYLGDYVDRGPESREIIDLLLAGPLPGFETVYLKGNHEDFMLEFLDDPGIGPSWLFNGGEATLESYGLAAKLTAPRSARDILATQEAFAAALPANHLKFLRGLRLSHVVGDYLFVHAGIRPGLALSTQNPHDLMWIREEFLDSADRHDKFVVHGHTITWEPHIAPNRIGIDTGAFVSGVLTCLVLEGTTRDFLHTSGPAAGRTDTFSLIGYIRGFFD